MSEATVLFHVSDIHFGYEDRAALDWFAGEVSRQRPALVLCTGDVTMRGTAREFAAAGRWLASLEAPVRVDPGNHDVPYYWYPLARVFRPWRHYRDMVRAVGTRAELADVAVIPLRTVAAFQWRLNLSKGRVATVDLDAALQGLSHHHARPLRLVTCHHPLIEASTRSRASTRGGRRALAALARAGADAVLSGHVHDPFDLTLEQESGRSIRMIGAGTLSQRLRVTRPSYNRLVWDRATGLQVELQTMP